MKEMDITFSQWDYDVSGEVIYKLEGMIEPDKLKLFIANSMNPEEFIFVRVDLINLEHIKVLIDYGFYIVDTVILYDYAVNENAFHKKEFNIVKLDKRDSEYCQMCLKIIDDEFNTGHLFQDHNLGREFGNIVYNAWFLNNLSGRGETFIYLRHDVVLGFVQVVSLDDKLLQIDLIGVVSDKQSTGIGSDLMDYIKYFAYKNRYMNITVGTQKDNYGANKLYLNQGFNSVNTCTSLHFKK